MKAARRIAILVFDNVELLDIAGPHDVFATAAALAEATPPVYDVMSVASRTGKVRSSSGLALRAALRSEIHGQGRYVPDRRRRRHSRSLQ